MPFLDPQNITLENQKPIAESTYKKRFGAWGENRLDEWMATQGWEVYHQNLKLRHGEIDRVYQNAHSHYSLHSSHSTHTTAQFCVAEIKTIFCEDKKRFFSLFTEVGLSSLIKWKQISNLYKYAENLRSRNLQSQQIKNICVRFFIVLKMYKNYEKESFFSIQKNYKVCLQTSNNLILSFVPEFKM